MAAPLNQLQLSYSPEQDRILLTLSTKDRAEYRIWITRRTLKGLWNLLGELKKLLLKQGMPSMDARGATERIHKDTPQPLASKYGTNIAKHPLGDTPLLLNKITARPLQNGLINLKLESLEGVAIDFAADDGLLNALSQMLNQTATKAEWDLPLKDIHQTT